MKKTTFYHIELIYLCNREKKLKNYFYMFLLCVYSQNDEMSIMANKNNKKNRYQADGWKKSVSVGVMVAIIIINMT